MITRLILPGPESLPLWWVVTAFVLVCLALLSWRGRPAGALLIALGMLALAVLALDPVYERRYEIPQQLSGALLIDESLSVWAHQGANAEELKRWLRKRLPILQDKHVQLDLYGSGDTFTSYQGGLSSWHAPRLPSLNSLSYKAIMSAGKRYDFVLETGDGLPNLSTTTGTDATPYIFLGLPPGWRRGRQVALGKIHSEAFGLVRHPIRIAFSIITRAAPEATSLQVGFPDASPPSVTTVSLPPGTSEVTGHVDLLVTAAGTRRYRLSIVNPPRWDGLAMDNSAVVAIEGFREKIRILMISGAPGPDTRFIRSVLKQDPLIELMHFSILRNSRNHPKAPNRELSLIPFPYHELFTTMLPQFDVVLLQNFNFFPYFQRRYPLYFRNLEQSVRASGTGLMLTGGSLSFGAGAYGSTEVGQILGVKMFPKDWRSGLPPQKVDIRAGMGLPFVPDVTIDDYNLMTTVQTTVLAQLPSAAPPARPVPIVIARRYGQGRGLAVAAQSLFDPGKQDHPDLIRHWLRQAVRWLAGDLEEGEILVKIVPDENSRVSVLKLVGATGQVTATVQLESGKSILLTGEVTQAVRWPADLPQRLLARVWREKDLLSNRTLYVDPAAAERPDLWKTMPVAEQRPVDRDLLADRGISTAAASGRRFDHLVEDRDSVLAVLLLLLSGWFLSRRPGRKSRGDRPRI